MLCLFPLPELLLSHCHCQAVAKAEPFADACLWPISIHKFIHTFAKYNLQVPDTNAMPVAVAVAIAIAKAVPLVNALASDLPMANLNAQIHSYFC